MATSSKYGVLQVHGRTIPARTASLQAAEHVKEDGSSTKCSVSSPSCSIPKKSLESLLESRKSLESTNSFQLQRAALHAPLNCGFGNTKCDINVDALPHNIPTFSLESGVSIDLKVFSFQF